jgi:dihydropteroate synthase
LILDCGDRPIDLGKPQVMGILNLTPDSFSDGGLYERKEAALAHARQMAAAGAAIIDLGGESTRPGAEPVSEQQELERVIPVLETLSRELDVALSIDTSKPGVMREAVAAGAGLINDVAALRAPGALQTAAELQLPVCLMHMRGEPRTMQQSPAYGDVVQDVMTFLRERILACQAAGIPRSRLLIDPGFGFGKTLAHNLQLLKRLDELRALAVPVLVGLSRKSMIGALLGDAPVDERLHGSVAAAVLAVLKGAVIVRTHDVRATVDAFRVVTAVTN